MNRENQKSVFAPLLAGEDAFFVPKNICLQKIHKIHYI
jgi:hypothetical protein